MQQACLPLLHILYTIVCGCSLCYNPAMFPARIFQQIIVTSELTEKKFCLEVSQVTALGL